MTVEWAIDLIRQMITVSLTLAGPILATALSVGIGVSLLQAVTSIQEQTLTFVPKVIAIAGVFALSAHWMLGTLMEFCIQVFQTLPQMTQ